MELVMLTGKRSMVFVLFGGMLYSYVGAMSVVATKQDLVYHTKGFSAEGIKVLDDLFLEQQFKTLMNNAKTLQVPYYVACVTTSQGYVFYDAHALNQYLFVEYPVKTDQLIRWSDNLLCDKYGAPVIDPTTSSYVADKAVAYFSCLPNGQQFVFQGTLCDVMNSDARLRDALYKNWLVLQTGSVRSEFAACMRNGGLANYCAQKDTNWAWRVNDHFKRALQVANNFENRAAVLRILAAFNKNVLGDYDSAGSYYRQLLEEKSLTDRIDVIFELVDLYMYHFDDYNEGFRNAQKLLNQIVKMSDVSEADKIKAFMKLGTIYSTPHALYSMITTGMTGPSNKFFNILSANVMYDFALRQATTVKSCYEIEDYFCAKVLTDARRIAIEKRRKVIEQGMRSPTLSIASCMPLHRSTSSLYSLLSPRHLPQRPPSACGQEALRDGMCSPTPSTVSCLSPRKRGVLRDKFDAFILAAQLTAEKLKRCESVPLDETDEKLVSVSAAS